MSLEPEEILSVAVPAAIALLGLMVGLLVSRSVVSRLAKTAEQTRSVAGNVVVAAVRGPLVLWFFIAGLYAAVQVTDLPPNIAALIQKLLLALVILSVSWALARIVGALVEAAAERAGGAVPSATLVTNIARLTVLALGVMVILQTLGISITPLLTALGVGGLAVALALQPTLANLFAGINILTSRKVRPGDYVKLASGEEGMWSTCRGGRPRSGSPPTT